MALYAKQLLMIFFICCAAATNHINTYGLPQQGNTVVPQTTQSTTQAASAQTTKPQTTKPQTTKPQTTAPQTTKPSSQQNSSSSGIHVKYGRLSCQELYYYLPSNMNGVKNIIFMVHGGAWTSGDCSQFEKHAKAAAKLGYIAVSMDYRKFQNGANAYDMVSDVANAISAFKKQLDSKNIKYNKMALCGWSAGAHLSLLYAYEYYYQKCPIPIAFMCVCAPPTDFLSDAHTVRTIMGQGAYTMMSSLSGEIILPGTENSHMKAIKAISPIYMVKPGVPPTIVVNGEDDDVVPPQNSADLYVALQRNGVDSKRVIYKNGAGHFLGSQYAEEKVRTQVFMEFAAKYF